MDLLSCLPGAVKALSDRRGAGGGGSKGAPSAAAAAGDPAAAAKASGEYDAAAAAAGGAAAATQGGLQAEEEADAGVQGAGFTMHQFRPEIQVRGHGCVMVLYAGCRQHVLLVCLATY
jgi:hypothetical protein